MSCYACLEAVDTKPTVFHNCDNEYAIQKINFQHPQSFILKNVHISLRSVPCWDP